MTVQSEPLTDADRALIAEAGEVLAEGFEPNYHHVASALRTDSGATYAAINLIAGVGNADVHCEPITVANAIMDGETGLDATAAVYYPEGDPANEYRIVSACGVCRELLSHFDSTVDVVFRGDDGPVKAPVADLLPAKA